VNVPYEKNNSQPGPPAQSGLNNFTGVGQDGRAVSDGCQVICRSQYSDFETATGMTPSDGSAPQRHFTVTVDTDDNRLYENPVLGPPES